MRGNLQDERGKQKKHVLVWNTLGLVGGVCWALAAQVGKLGAMAQRESSWVWLGVGLLVAGELLVLCNWYRSARFTMFFGGLVTLPMGVFALAASFILRRLHSEHATRPAAGSRCRECGYDLRGTPVPRCPECGYLVGFNKPAGQLGLNDVELRGRSRGSNE